jgi:hypothetical protein
MDTPTKIIVGRIRTYRIGGSTAGYEMLSGLVFARAS